MPALFLRCGWRSTDSATWPVSGCTRRCTNGCCRTKARPEAPPCPVSCGPGRGRPGRPEPDRPVLGWSAARQGGQVVVDGLQSLRGKACSSLGLLTRDGLGLAWVAELHPEGRQDIPRRAAAPALGRWRRRGRHLLLPAPPGRGRPAVPPGVLLPQAGSRGAAPGRVRAGDRPGPVLHGWRQPAGYVGRVGCRVSHGPGADGVRPQDPGGGRPGGAAAHRARGHGPRRRRGMDLRVFLRRGQPWLLMGRGRCPSPATRRAFQVGRERRLRVPDQRILANTSDRLAGVGSRRTPAAVGHRRVLLHEAVLSDRAFLPVPQADAIFLVDAKLAAAEGDSCTQELCDERECRVPRGITHSYQGRA